MTHRESIQRQWRVREMAEGFATAALWADGEPLCAVCSAHPSGERNCEEHGEDGPERGGLEHLAVDDESMDAIRALCAAFYALNAEDLEAYADQYEPAGGFSVWECAGHDLYLTASGHGVGFFDRGLGELGDRLSDACHIAPFSDIEHSYPFQVSDEMAEFDGLPSIN